MDLQASKIELAKMVLETESASLIEKIKALFSNENILSDSQMKAIDEALEEFDRGEGIPHEVVMKEMKERYPKYFK